MNDAAVIFSYSPLAYGAPTATEASDTNVEEFVKQWADLPEPHMIGCAWAMDTDGNPFPVFIYEEAKEIFHHIHWYSGSRPDKWFYFALRDFGTGYAVCLMPNIKQSIDRYKYNAEQINPDVSVEDIDSWNVLFRGLVNGFDSVENIRKIPLPTGTTSVGLATMEQLQGGEEPYILENIPVGTEQLSEQYLDNFIKGYQESKAN